MMEAGVRKVVLTAALVLLAGCVRVIPEGHPPGHYPPAPRYPHPGAPPASQPAQPQPPVAQTPPVPVSNAVSVGVQPGPAMATLGITDANARPALVAFRASCPRLVSRADTSGLTRALDWQDVCAAAAGWPETSAAAFFLNRFEAVQVGDGRSYVTGYYEPEIAGVRQRQPGYDTPVYGMPVDLVHARPGDAPVKPNGMTPFGRYDETGQFTPYYDRTAIEAGIIEGKAPIIGWAADPIELFFLQVQGSGRLRAPDGSVIRIGYAGDNGQNYTNIGAVMRNQGLIGTGPGQYAGSMQGVMQYLRDHPEDGRALMDQNKSWVFFREITGDGPIGALGVPVRAHVSVAADPLFVPLGAPLFLSTDRGVVNGLWVAQDTGGAIKGANRIDSFWGAGVDARQTAGGMSARGSALVLLPRGVLSRLAAR